MQTTLGGWICRGARLISGQNQRSIRCRRILDSIWTLATALTSHRDRRGTRWLTDPATFAGPRSAYRRPCKLRVWTLVTLGVDTEHRRDVGCSKPQRGSTCVGDRLPSGESGGSRCTGPSHRSGRGRAAGYLCRCALLVSSRTVLARELPSPLPKDHPAQTFFGRGAEYIGGPPALPSPRVGALIADGNGSATEASSLATNSNAEGSPPHFGS